MKKVLIVLLYSLICGALLAVYTQIQGMLKYIFSIGAIIVGVRFFKNYESLAMRISMILMSIVMFFVVVLIIAIILFARNPQAPVAG